MAGQRPLAARWRFGFEKYSWLFMRGSGVLVLVLVAAHLFTNLLVGDGVRRINFAFVAGKWASPLWQGWALVLLWLALAHGVTGVRTVISDYVRPGVARRALHCVAYLAAAVVIVLGTLVVVTFDPCPVGAPAHLLPTFCPAVAP